MLQVRDQMAQLAAENGLKVSDSIAAQLLPTPALGHIRNYDEPVEDYLARRKKMEDGEYKGMPGVSLGVALRMEMLPTPIVRDYKDGSTAKQVEAGAPKSRLEDQVYLSWGKFEPAIRRWEAVLGRPAPAPTKPDGKDGSHRLSSAFTEWMMGLPKGWITDVGLSRVDELKACGNGVVPQQAELALRILLEGVDLNG
jgi:DNA (cytosine-5)-methyltransferase 1